MTTEAAVRKTIKVRVLVATWEAEGMEWYAAEGWPGREEDIRAAILDICDGGAWPESDNFRWTWVEAEVPLPEPVETVQGQVEDPSHD